ncbi:MAG TPA: RIP metalloprotease [Acidimicrobiia bacterium]|jgi:membrane-associated protease RseP (regulator of RpoE activity)|nr:RIP metalloprotease [Acidimicrobiia bacterium]
MLYGLGTVFAVIVFVLAHEAGHFLAAKAVGMRASEFFFGFGPRLWSFRRGETEYGFKLLPLGGYVRIVGMNPLEEVLPQDLGRTYREKKFWEKSVVVLAGVGMNFLIAYLMFFGIMLAFGISEPTNTISLVAEETDDGFPTPAATAGLVEGDRIVAIDGSTTATWEDISRGLAGHPDQPVVLTIERAGERREIMITLASRTLVETGEVVGFLGVSPEFVDVPVGVWPAAGLAGRLVADGVGRTFGFLGELIRPASLAKLFQGLFGGEVPDDLRPVSPIGLVRIGAQAERVGVDFLLTLLASTNIILGTLNVLPLYPLDGGHFALALYEKVTKRQADVRRLIPVAAAVIAFVSFLGLVAIVLDLVDPINL